MGLPNKTNLLPDRPGIPPMAALPEAETIDPAALAKAYADGDIDLVCVTLNLNASVALGI